MGITKVDYSILSTFATCEEKARLAYVLHLQPLKEEAPLSFGHAIHAGVAALHLSDWDVASAKKAFVADLKDAASELPLGIDSQERRSVERGLGLIEAYAERWKGAPWKIEYRGSEPLVEIGFSTPITEDCLYVGRVDRVMRSTMDGRLYAHETKTTSGALSNLARSIRPNHQITGYFYALSSMLDEPLGGVVLDGIFVSDRQPNIKKGSWLALGVDIEKDFDRIPTQRTRTDVEEWLRDVENLAYRYIKRVSTVASRWTRNAPTACTMYGGCKYRDICATNLNPNIIATNYIVKPWEPWEGAMKGGKVNG